MQNNTNWYVVKASVAGNSHIDRNIPCQDYSHYKTGKNWVVAAVADGAGSQSHSEIGSKLACEVAVQSLANEVDVWRQVYGGLPATKDWDQIANRVLDEVVATLRAESNVSGIDLKAYSSTLMVVVALETRLYGFHVGDGRGCYQDPADKIWKPLFTPFKGEFANETVFITSAPIVENQREEYFGTFSYDVPKATFALLSDGCEMHSFECHIVDAETGNYSDPNRPFPGFFDKVLGPLKDMAAKQSNLEVNRVWEQFLTNGTEGLANEADDKTMLISFWN